MAEEWKEKIIKDKLGGKKDWTEEERAELCRRLDQDLDKHIDSIEKKKYEGGWTEENWKEQMAEHPMFAPYLLEDGVTEGEAPLTPLSEGLAQLKFDPDHNTPQEIAESYKEEGNFQFKYKKYRLAIANFSEGLKQKCPDNVLNAQLHNNRAAAHFHLGNNRSALKDCEKAIELKPDYLKTVIRAVDCCVEMKVWDEVFNWCDRGLKLDPNDKKLQEMRLKSVKEKKLHERDLRKKSQAESKKERMERSLVETILSRGVNLGTAGMKDSASINLAELEPCHPAAKGSRVHLNESGALVWPVLLLYPEHTQTDIIQEFTETDRLMDHLAEVFGPSSPPAPWDLDNKYQLQNLHVFFEDRRTNKLCRVDPNHTLGQILADPRYQVLGGTPGLTVLAEGKFMDTFLNRYK